jgi:putative hemolysin
LGGLLLFNLFKRSNSQSVCICFILLLQFLPDTTPVIALAGQQAPFALLPPPPLEVDAFQSTHFLTSAAPPVSPQIHAEVGPYRVRLAVNESDRKAACRLRFNVFNIELSEGLESSYHTGLDTDQFDKFCEHLLVENKEDGKIVGTYRLQSGLTAGANAGYYTGREFDLAPYEPLRSDILELGRASTDREHRTAEVLTLLWRGIAQYATDMGLRYLIGCSSLNSKRPADGWQMYRQLEPYRVSPEFRTVPTDVYVCPIEQEGSQSQLLPFQGNPSPPINVPRLLKTYLTIGARICAPPAWDRDFGTIDFLTLLDLKSLSSAARNRFLAPLIQ